MLSFHSWELHLNFEVLLCVDAVSHRSQRWGFGQKLSNKQFFFVTYREVLDGINIDISYHTERYWFDEFIVELRRLMDTDISRKYLITTTTPCSFPNFWLGETYARNSILFDSFFISFVDSCAPQTVSAFNQALSQWSTLPGPSIYIGLPSNKDILNMGRFYMKPNETVALYKVRMRLIIT